MTIEALFPSRRQSQRHNPLFARERRRKRLLSLLALGFGLFCFVGLRIPPGPAQASSVSLHRIAQAAPAAPKRKVRIIQIYKIPSCWSSAKAELEFA
jgi:hypothetical protein